MSQTIHIDPEILSGEKPFDNATSNSNQQEPTNEYLEKFRQSILDQKKEYPDPEPVINFIQRGETMPLLTLKSFSLWQGKQKSKKTTILAIAVAAFIADYNRIVNNEGTFMQAALKGVVLVIDTEQGQSYAARTMKLILRLADLVTSPNLIYSDLREHTASRNEGK